ncbi:MBL fold metallo-hydrolase [Methylocaldum sp.]|uniref:MBL fold metallo-hydrolase n=1 Tax=Methylocaldum sp. TaxID=1969727 RepID=UPI002D26E64A|nr:MBL fold metallo-hydrolase [Methylocaldum sp.]HYE34029.1 MBL fold metallo-hydrolase [Methylocaldum sp.]
MPNFRRISLPASQDALPDFGNGSIFFIGTATVILRYAGFTILTDPNFLHAGDHAHLGYGLTSKRLTDPAIDIEQLPPLDFVVLSHYHGDHFDQIVEERLPKDVPIVTTAHAAGKLKNKGFTATMPLRTWESVTVEKNGAKVLITAMPGRHGPPVLAKLLPPVMGSMLDFQTSEGLTTLCLYITGDTLVFDDLKEIPKRYPDIDLGLFHLGGTRIMGVLLTMDAKEGIEAIRIVNPREAIPIHYNDYEVFKSPIEDFKKAVTAAGLDDRVRYLSHGETHRFEVPKSRFSAKSGS